MQTIPDSFKQAGREMRLVRRNGKVALYRMVDRDYWEVHRVRVAAARRIFDSEVPEREVLASSEEFGSVAWACTTAERAEARFAEARG